ncbi:MAG: prefoldin subunit alpha [Candidatus Aenigmarchaeota archaeon]|nr:prefoldin subunit alpha [Candidatus Aenigmarchaeota archaeon]
MNEKKEIQGKLIRYQILDGRIKALLKRRELLIAKILEIETTLSTIEEIEKNKESEILLPFGSNVHVPGTLKDIKKMIVELGANMAIEEDVEETKKILEKRKNIINDGLRITENEITSLSNEMLKLESEIGALIEKIKPEVTAD